MSKQPAKCEPVTASNRNEKWLMMMVIEMVMMILMMMVMTILNQ
jgi:hypothetical protein